MFIQPLTSGKALLSLVAEWVQEDGPGFFTLESLGDVPL